MAGMSVKEFRFTDKSTVYSTKRLLNILSTTATLINASYVINVANFW